MSYSTSEEFKVTDIISKKLTSTVYCLLFISYLAHRKKNILFHKNVSRQSGHVDLLLDENHLYKQAE